MVSSTYESDRWQDNVPEVPPEQTPTDEYWDLTRKLVYLTGHENWNLSGDAIAVYERRYGRFNVALETLNKYLKLNFDAKDIDLLTLVYVALSDSSRFGENEHIAEEFRENTASHSLHAPLHAHLLIRRALERLKSDETEESVTLRYVISRCLLMHDLGEALGEPGSLAQESKNEDFAKDKPIVEELVARRILQNAAAAHGTGDVVGFLLRLKDIQIPNISAQAITLNDDDFLALVQSYLGPEPQISAEQQAHVDGLMDFWKLHEQTQAPARFATMNLNHDFIRQFASLSEHLQGEGHYLLFIEDGPDGKGGAVSAERMQSYRQIRNLNYNEGEVGNVFAAAKTPLEKAIAIEAKRQAYETSIGFLKKGPDAIDRNATAQTELEAADPGRRAEIAELGRCSEEEGATLDAQGLGHVIRTIETKERLIAMYEWARDNDDFIPAPGQTLIIDPPAEFKAVEGKFTAAAAASKKARAR